MTITDSSDSRTSATLILEVQRGYPEAWERFVRLYGPLIYAWCRQCRLQEADAADCVQNVMRSLQSGIAKFAAEGPGATFRGWLWTVTRNRIRDFLRDRDRQILPQGGTDANARLAAIPDIFPPDSDESIRLERDLLQRKALELIREKSDDRTWQAFWRCAVEGESPTQIAADLGFTVNYIHKVRRRYLERLRRDLAGFLDPEK